MRKIKKSELRRWRKPVKMIDLRPGHPSRRWWRFFGRVF